jgi:hypothetical protein
MFALRKNRTKEQRTRSNDNMASSFEERVQKAIPARWHMISGSADSQTSADVQNVNQFQLPNPAGKPGGACTSAFLDVLYKDGTIPMEQPSWVTVLKQMRRVLQDLGYDQVCCEKANVLLLA